MNRLLTLASGGVFATTLAILPISGFAQQNDAAANPSVKPVVPMTQQTSGMDAKTPAKTAATGRQTTAAKPVNLHKLKPVTTHAACTSAPTSAATPMGTDSTSAQPPSTPSTAQPKVVDPGKS